MYVLSYGLRCIHPHSSRNRVSTSVLGAHVVPCISVPEVLPAERSSHLQPDAGGTPLESVGGGAAYVTCLEVEGKGEAPSSPPLLAR